MEKTNIVDITTTINDIPHLATTLWFSGCNLDCAGCHNSRLEFFEKGLSLKVVTKILKERRKMTDWLVYLGGNPLDSIDVLLEVSTIAEDLGFNQFLYSGYTFDEFKNMFNSEIHSQLLMNFDYIKTGRFDARFSKRNCKEDGVEFFFETLNQEVYKKEEKKQEWKKYYNFDFSVNRICGNLNLI